MVVGGIGRLGRIGVLGVGGCEVLEAGAVGNGCWVNRGSRENRGTRWAVRSGKRGLLAFSGV